VGPAQIGMRSRQDGMDGLGCQLRRTEWAVEVLQRHLVVLRRVTAGQDGRVQLGGQERELVVVAALSRGARGWQTS
jgi:hypothetical protein